MEKKKCELCDGLAKVYCESDQASLCWLCDGMVHGANFLVAKHSRCLLCTVCHSPTPWRSSGLRLAPTVSICESCLARKNNNSVAAEESINENMSQVINGGDDEAESQVVPSDAATAQKSLVVSSSSSASSREKAFSGNGGLVSKRTKQHSDFNCSDKESSDSPPLKRSRNLVKINGYNNLNLEITQRQ